MDRNLRKIFITNNTNIYINHDKAYTRKQSKKHEKRKYKLAKELGILQENSSHKKRLCKNGWSCSCFLCKPTRKTNIPTLKKKKELLKEKSALKELEEIWIQQN